MANESHVPPSEKGLEQKIQGGEGEHICAQCNKPFSNAGNLKRHLLIHAGEKKLKCMQCNYSTNEAGNLRNHTKIHSGDKGDLDQSKAAFHTMRHVTSFPSFPFPLL